MSFEPRKRLRLPAYDYRQAGWYFLTICAADRAPLFGHVDRGRMILGPIGELVAATWQSIPEHHPHVQLDASVVMPNHLHGLLFIPEPACGLTEAWAPPTAAGGLGALVRSFKSAATRAVRLAVSAFAGPVWQSGYYEHIVRTDEGVEYVRWYIEQNPARWHLDRENHSRAARDPFDAWIEAQGPQAV
jgi:putative transposase